MLYYCLNIIADNRIKCRILFPQLIILHTITNFYLQSTVQIKQKTLVIWLKGVEILEMGSSFWKIIFIYLHLHLHFPNFEEIVMLFAAT